MKLIKANESTASRRRAYFHLVTTDGVTPATAESGGQPQVSSDGGAWTDTGIGTLSAVGNGRYYAELTQAAVQTPGTSIETRYKSANTAECPGESVQVVAFDPHDANSLGLSRLDQSVGSRLASADYTAPANADVAAVKAVADKLDTALEADGAVYRLTENALEQAPAGGGQTGSGALDVTVTVTDDLGTPLDGAAVWISTDQVGNNVVAGTKYTTAMGQVAFKLDAGAYWCHRQLAGYEFDPNPAQISVS